MAYYGYHRVSTSEQKLDRGINEIERFGRERNIKIERIFTDKQSGRGFDRPRYQVMKEDVLRSGDVLIVTELDRLGRNKLQVVQELNYYKEKGIRVLILEIPTSFMDYSTFGNDTAKLLMEMANNIMIEIYATIAQQETEKRAMRQAQGIEAKRLNGDWDFGRPRVLTMEEFAANYQKVLSGTVRPFDLMKQLKLSKPTYYRYKKQYDINTSKHPPA